MSRLGLFLWLARGLPIRCRDAVEDIRCEKEIVAGGLRFRGAKETEWLNALMVPRWLVEIAIVWLTN
jgi:hypothetical protein